MILKLKQSFSVFAFLLISLGLFAQNTSILEIEENYKNLYDIERLEALNELSTYYVDSNPRKALRYARQAVFLSENIFVETNSLIDFKKQDEQVKAYLLLAKILFNKEDYFSAKESLSSAKIMAEKLKLEGYKRDAIVYLDKIQAMIDSGEISESFFSKTLGNLNIGETINKTTNDLAIQSEVTLGNIQRDKGEFHEAISHYEKVINLMRNKGDAVGVKEYQLKIAVLLDSLEEYSQAQKFLSEAIADSKQNDSLKVRKSTKGNENAQNEKVSKLENELIEDQDKLKELKELADDYANAKNFEKSLAYERMYNELSKKIIADSLIIVAEKKQAENEILLLRQQKKIADLNVNEIEKEKERQIGFRNIMFLVAALILISTFVVFYFYSAKRKEHKKLTITHNDLQKTKGKLVDAEKKIMNLLKQQLSGDIAQELMHQNGNELGQKSFVCIMFLDIRDFTPLAEKTSPEELIAFQNVVFGFMIDIVQSHHGNINQLLGDGFMASFGAPKSHGNDCQNAFLAAKQILVELNERIEAGILKKIKIGIGLHAGNVVTGNVGNESRKQYSITGNPVIIASRVEQLNKEYKTQLIITEEVFEKLDKEIASDSPFEEVMVKGRSNPIRIQKFS